MSKLTSPVVWATSIAAIGLVVIAWVAARTRADVRRSIDAVNHTLNVQQGLNLVLKSVLDAETAQRGFLLTGSPAYLAPYRESQLRMDAALSSLAQLTAHDTHRQARVAQLRPLVIEKMRELRATLDLAEQDRHEAALAIVKTDRGRLLMERIRALLDAAFVDEQRSLREQQTRLDKALVRRGLMTNGMALLLLAAVVLAGLQRARLRRLQPLVTLCAWSKTVQDGDRWVSFEEYLERRFGVRVTHGLSPDELTRLLDQPRPR